MKLNVKMMLLFSAIMLIALFAFSSYSIQTNIDGSEKYTAARFVYMSASISSDLEQSFHIMKMTANDLSNNLSFLSSLNQFIRDDSADQKMATAARKAALQSLYQSPLVDQYYRVSFISADGSRYITSLTDKDFDPSPVPEALLGALAGFPIDAAENPGPAAQILPPHPDVLSVRSEGLVYGISQAVQYNGVTIGYLSILDECTSLSHLTKYLDDPEEIEIQAVFDDGSLLYSNTASVREYSEAISPQEFQEWNDPKTGAVIEVLLTRIDSLGINLYLAHDKEYRTIGNNIIRRDFIKRTALIMAVAFAFIGMISMGLTRSVRRLTKRVKQMSSRNVLLGDSGSDQALTESVTSPGDHEIHVLEMAYNDMLLRLRDSTLNELALRESTLQAQLNALQAQINPHFIYNTLNIISAKSMESGNFDVIEICSQFASLLRYSTDTSSRTATMAEEIENVRNYLLLAKARYEENLEFVIEVPDELQNIEVPKLTLQPLVENALTHGYNGKNMLRRLSVIGNISDNFLNLSIRDNGTGFSDEMLDNLRRRIREIESEKITMEGTGRHIGLVNTCLRLYYYSKGAIHVSIYNDNGAVILLTMELSR